MNYKERFLKSIDEYEVDLKKIKSETEEEKMDEVHKEELAKLRANLEAIIGEKREELGFPSKAPLDKDYQLRLKNLMGVFSKDGKKMTTENIVKGLVLFTEDPAALGGLRDSLTKAGLTETEVDKLIPLDHKGLTIAKLSNLESSLDKKLILPKKESTEEKLDFLPFLDELDGDFNYKA